MAKYECDYCGHEREWNKPCSNCFSKKRPSKISKKPFYCGCCGKQVKSDKPFCRRHAIQYAYLEKEQEMENLYREFGEIKCLRD